MRVALPLIALFVSTAAAAPQNAQVQPAPAPNSVLPESALRDGSSVVCRDRIMEVRRELGQPSLPRSAGAEEPLFIAAVDKRVAGCSVLVMRNDTNDIRPLPGPQEHRLMPAR